MEKVEIEEMREKQVQKHRNGDTHGVLKGAGLPPDGVGREVGGEKCGQTMLGDLGP